MRTSLWLVVFAALAFSAAAAANPGVSGNPPANPSFGVSIPAQALDAPATGSALAPRRLVPAAPFMSGINYVQRVYPPRVYRPRPSRPPMSAMPFAAQVHVGFFEPFKNFSTGFDGGFRIGPQPDPHLQFGFGMDWWHRSSDNRLDLGTVQAPGGSASEELILSESTANLIPIMLFVQVSGDESMPVIPYGGFGAGYEWLFLSANDFVTHESFDQTFGAFGWQIWAGAGLPLDWRMRVNAEVYFNVCKVGTDVDVNIPNFGPATVREIINVDGVGMRLGVSWRF